jgi:hypothetical protein
VTGYFDAAPRSIAPEDAEAVHALVLGVLGVTPYVDRTLDLVAAAERGDPEVRALVIARDGTVAALALFGPVSAASGAWHLHMLLTAAGIAARDVGGPLVDAALAEVRASGGRFLLAELPADPVIGSALTLLRAKAFKQVGRIPDFYRDGVALLFLRRDL